MEECHRCRKGIRGETGVHCAGVCGRSYHKTQACAAIDEYCLQGLVHCPFLRFMCDDCVTYISNVDDALKQMLSIANSNKINIREQKLEVEKLISNHNKEISALLANNDKEIEKAIDNINKVAEKFNKQSERLCKEAEESRNESKRICNDMVKQITTNQREKKIAKSYAEKVKEVPQFRKEMPLIVKPRNKQTSEKTQNDLNENVDPNPLRIANIEKRGNGIIIIESENDDERSKIKKAIEQNMNKNYEVKIPDAIKPKFRLYNMKFKHNEEVIIEKLKKQNHILQNSNLKLKKLFEVKRENKMYYNAIIETDGDTFSKIIDAERLNIGWERCRVFDAVEVTRCFKCKGYNHRAAECRNEETCGNCHGRHSTKTCRKEMLKKCINCIRVNERLNMDLDVNHITTSKVCPVYMNKIENYKKKIGY